MTTLRVAQLKRLAMAIAPVGVATILLLWTTITLLWATGSLESEFSIPQSSLAIQIDNLAKDISEDESEQSTVRNGIYNLELFYHWNVTDLFREFQYVTIGLHDKYINVYFSNAKPRLENAGSDIVMTWGVNAPDTLLYFYQNPYDNDDRNVGFNVQDPRSGTVISERKPIKVLVLTTENYYHNPFKD